MLLVATEIHPWNINFAKKKKKKKKRVASFLPPFISAILLAGQLLPRHSKWYVNPAYIKKGKKKDSSIHSLNL